MGLTNSFRTCLHLLAEPLLALKLLRTYDEFGRGDTDLLWGSVTDREQEVLRSLVGKASRHPGPIIEVGTLFGLTTQLIAVAKEPDRKLITIDNYSWNPFHISSEDHLKFTHRALRYCKQHSNVEIYDGSSAKFYDDYRGERPSMIFIDADHSYEGVRRDIAWAKQMKIPVICGHDYSPRWPGIKRAADEAFGSQTKVQETIWSSVS